MVGYHADLSPGSEPEASPVHNATAIGTRALVSRSNSLVLGSISGINGATNNVKVGIGTSSPSVPLHVSRSDGTARILVENTSNVSKASNMFELNNLGPVQFHMINRKTGVDWTFRNNFRKAFTIQAGTTIQFELNKKGDLAITGDLTVNGISYTSDRNQKQNFTQVDPKQVLEKLVLIPVTEWNFKRDNTRHIGPMAQDFYAAFGVGKDDKHLNPTDTAGVTMAAIQGLYQQLKEKDAQLEDQHLEIQGLKAQLAKLETLETRLHHYRSNNCPQEQEQVKAGFFAFSQQNGLLPSEKKISRI